jgi:hypothetical protein
VISIFEPSTYAPSPFICVSEPRTISATYGFSSGSVTFSTGSVDVAGFEVFFAVVTAVDEDFFVVTAEEDDDFLAVVAEEDDDFLAVVAEGETAEEERAVVEGDAE